VADVNANIDINIDSSNAISQLKSLQRQISQFHTSIAKSSESAALAQRGLEKNLLNSINSIGSFSAELRTVKTTAESFTTALEGNKFSMREYFRYAGGSTKTFGKLFRSEFDTIGKVAEERVKKLQTQYIKMGRDTTGAMKAIAVMPKSLDMSDYNTKIQVAAQKQALFNQLMKQGSTNLLNFGKNTQWAGRQLMVGFTIPLTILGSTASKTFMEMEAQALKFKKVYGDLFTSQEETQAALDGITELGQMFTKYGVAVSSTVGLAAEAAAAGFQGLDLQRQTTEATRLSILGQIDNSKALETTISLQNAFGMSSDKLADSINFLNAVENQTVVSLDDITTAIPKVAPVIQQLGGDVKDLTFFIAAMKEGGINASEGANALKSGLAALINPTRKANEMLAQFGINAKEIVVRNRGNLKATVVEFATALNQLDPLNRAQAIEQMFGKFQFARLSTLFANVAKDGNQASRVLNLANSSVEELSSLSEKELGMTAESSMNKFKKAVEDLKFALIPVGKAFLEAVTPIAEFIGNILSKFNDLSAGSKKAITLLVTVIGGLGPVLLMTFGLLANGVANIIKLFLTLRQGYQRLTGQSQVLGEQTQYLTMEQLDAAAVAHSLDQAHAKLTQRFTLEAEALNKLIIAYQSAATAGQRFAMNNPGMMLPPRAPKKLASGIVSVPGSGNKDTVPAMLAPGEAVIPSKFAKKYAPLIQGMVAGNIPGYKKGLSGTTGTVLGGSFPSRKYSPVAMMAPGNTAAGPGMDLEWLKLNEEAKASFAASIKTAMMMEQGIKVSMVNYEKFGQNLTPVLDNIFNIFKDGVTEDVTNISQVGETQYPLIIQHLKDLEQSSAITSKEFEQMSVAARKLLVPLKSDLTQQNLQRIELATDELGDTYVKRASTERSGKTYKGQIQKTFQRELTMRGLPQSKDYPGGYQFAHIPSSESTQTYVEPSLRKKAGTGSAAERSVMARVKQGETFKEGQLVMKKAGIDSMKAYESGTKSVNINDPYIQSRDRTSPHRLASADGKDDANAYENARQTVTKKRHKGSGIATRAAGAPSIGLGDIGPKTIISPAGLQAAADETRARQTATEKLGRLNGAIMGGTFALTSLASAGSMASGPLGDLSQQVMKFSGLLFGLMSITQLLTQTKIAELVATRAGLAKSAMANAMAAGPMFGGASKALSGKSGLLGGFARLALGIGKFLGPIGIATTGLVAFYSLTKMVNAARERERLAIEGLGKAANISEGQIKKLGDIYGFVPQRTTLALTPQVAGVVGQQRTKVEETKELLRKDKEFQKNVETLKKASAQEADIIFKSMGSKLLGAGATKEAIESIIIALREEAGRTNLDFKFKDIDLNTEGGRASIKKSVNDVLSAFSKDFKEGYSKINISTGGKNAIGTQVETISTELKTSLSTASEVVAANISSITGQFKNGTIKADIFKKSFDELSFSMESMKKDEALYLMNKTLIALAPNLAKAVSGLGDVATQMLIVQALAIGVAVTANDISLLNDAASGRAYPSAGASKKASIEKAIADRLKKDAEAIQAELDKFKTTTDGKTTEPSEIQRAIDSLKEKTKQILDQSAAYKILRDLNYDAATAADLAADSLVAAALASGKIKAGTEKWTEFLERIKQAKIAIDAEPAKKASQKFDTQKQAIEAQTKAMRTLLAAGYDAAEALDIVGDADLVALINDSGKAKLTFAQVKEKIDSTAEAIKNLKNLGNPFAAIEEQTDKFEKAFSIAMEKFRIEEEKAKKKFQPGIDTAQTEVDRIQKIIDGINKTIDGLQTKIKDRQRGIEKNITRQVEEFQDSIKVIEDKIKAEFDTPLEKISSDLEVLSHNLELIDHQSEEINSKYDLQAEALQKVSDINSDIADQQQKQLGLADALSRGDISAAAAAAQDMRAASAARAASAQSGFLDAGRKAELAALTAGGMTRLAIEQSQYKLGQDQYTLEQGRKLLQEKISNIQESKINPLLEKQKAIELDIRDIEDQIYELENSQTESLRSNNIELNNANIELDKANVKLQEALDEIAAQKQKWEDAKFGIDEAKNSVDILNTSLSAAQTIASNIASAWNSIKDKTITLTTKNVVTNDLSGGNNSGSAANVVPSVLAAQESGAIGAASIAAQLKAAVVAKAAADAVSEQAINLSRFKQKEAADLAAEQLAINAKGRVGRMNGGIIPRYMSSGGMAPKYFAVGGMSRGTDTVPAMLTPGEFVMSKYAVDSYGVDKMNAMNKGSYEGEKVYNYNLNVNVKSDANPEDIARVVMTQIRQVDSQRIRVQRG
jgi:TP901 family phage tail tape measure protein